MVDLLQLIIDTVYFVAFGSIFCYNDDQIVAQYRIHKLGAIARNSVKGEFLIIWALMVRVWRVIIGSGL